MPSDPDDEILLEMNRIRGGAWMEGRYIPSILAAIGGVIERHLIDIGFIEGEGLGLKADPKAEVMRVRKG